MENETMIIYFIFLCSWYFLTIDESALEAETIRVLQGNTLLLQKYLANCTLTLFLVSKNN